MRFDELNEDNYIFFAIKYYNNPHCTTKEEFNEDLKRFKYVKRLVNRYLDDKDLAERLILNHLIVIFNVFGAEAALNMLEVKLDKQHWPTVKPFLVFLQYITNDQLTGITMDKRVVEELRKI